MLVNVRDFVLVERHKNVCIGIRQIPVSAWPVCTASSRRVPQHVLKYFDTLTRIIRLRNSSPSKTASACDSWMLGAATHTGTETT
jgi:hypothetical protein